MDKPLVLGLVALAAFGCAQSSSDVGGAGGYAGGGAVGAQGGSGATASGGTGNQGGSSGAGATGAQGGSGGSSGGGGTSGSGGSGGSSGGSGGGGSCTPPVSGTCDTFPQCGCTSGQACAVIGTAGQTSCVVEGSVAPYGVCDQTNTCQSGYACVSEVCKPFCDTAGDCGGGDCVQVQYDDNGTPTDIPQFKVCSANCALENPSAVCGPGVGCFLYQSGGTDCAPAGSGTTLGACTTDPGACAPGYVCVDSSDCRKWCREGMGDCANCGGLASPPIINGVTYGVCP